MNNKINKIMQQLVEINTYITEDGTVKSSYKHSKLINGLIKNNKQTFVHEYDEDIIRTEAYASMQEALYTATSELELTKEEIIIENKKLMALAYKIAQFNLKKYLYAVSKTGAGKDRYTATKDTETLENYMKKEAIELDKEENNVPELYKYIERHKDEILTKGQQEYLDEKLGYVDAKRTKQQREHDRRKRRRIEKRIAVSLQGMSIKEAIKKDRDTIIGSLINAKDFRQEFLKHQDDDFIIEAIIDGVPSSIRKQFNSGSNSFFVINKYKQALAAVQTQRTH